MSLFYLFSCILTDTGHPLPWITGREGENEEKDVQTEEKEWRGKAHIHYSNISDGFIYT